MTRSLPVLTLLFAGCGGGPPPAVGEAEGRRVAEAFLAEVRAGKADAAWQETSTEFKSFLGKDAFRAFVKAHPALRGPAEFGGFAMTEANGVRVAECTFRAKGGAAIRVDLAPADGRWRVEKVAVGPG